MYLSLINYDSILQEVNLLSPKNSSPYESDSQEIIFSFNVSDENEISNCSLFVNGVFILLNSSISSDGSFVYIFSPENYFWNVNCSDAAGNIGNSLKTNFQYFLQKIMVAQ